MGVNFPNFYNNHLNRRQYILKKSKGFKLNTNSFNKFSGDKIMNRCCGQCLKKIKRNYGLDKLLIGGE